MALPQHVCVPLSGARQHRAARSSCADAPVVRSTPLRADTLKKSEDSTSDALFTPELTLEWPHRWVLSQSSRGSGQVMLAGGVTAGATSGPMQQHHHLRVEAAGYSACLVPRYREQLAAADTRNHLRACGRLTSPSRSRASTRQHHQGAGGATGVRVLIELQLFVFSTTVFGALRKAPITVLEALTAKVHYAKR